jgi:hypothetical protein
MTEISEAASSSFSLNWVGVSPFLLGVSFFYDNKLLSYPSFGSTLPFFSKFISPKRIKAKNFFSSMRVGRSEVKFYYDWS